MRVVIDTNVLVSAALRDKDPEAVILWIAAQPDWQWVVSSAILREYKEVLCREKFRLSQTVRHRWFELLDTLTMLVEADSPFEFSRDRKDAAFLACALATAADYFISGDRDFSEAKKLVTTTILSVSMFKRIIVDSAR